ncbi:PAMP-induced secreted peptide 2 [Camellia lanceoleosa]|uniref:PAMP-induced secreted peptide 2 n=1 Tax=Camellia lanceoleosa TaxID=1840588 RepID=A0ACC0I4Q9_9ERIC|nr:PAMP-induced secreted peptide 2 [Camellia lanceoleosa]
MVGSPIKQSLSFCLLILLLSAVFAVSQGRPFNILKRSHGGGIQSILDGLCFGAIKVSGPSPGDGNSFINNHTVGGIKDSSGPTPG